MQFKTIICRWTEDLWNHRLIARDQSQRWLWSGLITRIVWRGTPDRDAKINQHSTSSSSPPVNDHHHFMLIGQRFIYDEHSDRSQSPIRRRDEAWPTPLHNYLAPLHLHPIHTFVFRLNCRFDHKRRAGKIKSYSSSLLYTLLSLDSARDGLAYKVKEEHLWGKDKNDLQLNLSN